MSKPVHTRIPLHTPAQEVWFGQPPNQQLAVETASSNEAVLDAERAQLNLAKGAVAPVHGCGVQHLKMVVHCVGQSQYIRPTHLGLGPGGKVPMRDGVVILHVHIHARGGPQQVAKLKMNHAALHAPVASEKVEKSTPLSDAIAGCLTKGTNRTVSGRSSSCSRSSLWAVQTSPRF